MNAHNEQQGFTAGDIADQGARQFEAGYAAAKAEWAAAAPKAVAWYDPSNGDPGQSVTFEVKKRETWPHKYLVPLYAAPVAAAPGIDLRQPVAYLDLGAGGYVDVGSSLSDEQLAELPKGRHMLGIIGTYGVDGYVPADSPKGGSDERARKQMKKMRRPSDAVK